MSGYIPQNDAKFDEFYENLINYINTKCGGASPEWSHIPQSARTELQGGYAVWHPRWLETIPPHTSVQTQMKNEAKKAAGNIIRPFVNVYLREGQKAVLPEDRTAMMIPNKDTQPTPWPRPDIKPVAEGQNMGQGKQRVRAINPETGNRKKPPRVKGIAIASHVRHPDEPKRLPEDMGSYFQLDTQRDYQYGEAQYGMVADYAVAYEAPSGGRGPWSDIVSVIIA